MPSGETIGLSPKDLGIEDEAIEDRTEMPNAITPETIDAGEVEATEVKKTRVLFFDAPFHSDPDMEKQAFDDSGKKQEVPRGALSVATLLNRHGFESSVAVTDAFINKAFGSGQEEIASIARQFPGQDMDPDNSSMDLSEHRLQNPRDAVAKEAFFIEKLRQNIDTIIEQNDPDVIAFSYMFSPTERTIIAMIREIKQKFPDKKIVIGGNAASFDSGSRRKFLDPDGLGVTAIVDREGEWTMLDLVETIEANDGNLDTAILSNIPSLSYWDSKQGDVVQTEARDRAKSIDLEAIGPLSYDKLILPEGVNLGDFNHYVMFARGCQGNCAFCTSPRMYEHTISSIGLESFRSELESIAEAVETSGSREKNIGIMDDDILLEVGLDISGHITTDPSKIVARKTVFEIISPVLKSVKQKFPDISFFAQARVSHLRDIDPDEKVINKVANTVIENQEQVLRSMREAGIDLVLLGIESLSQKILDKTLKNSKVEWVAPACKKIKQAGIKAGAFWIVGLPGSTRENEHEALEKLKDLVDQGLIDELESHVLIPFPGTTVRIAAEQGKSTIQLDSDIDSASRNSYLSGEPSLEHRDKEGNVLLSKDDIRGILAELNRIAEKLKGTGQQQIVKV